MLALLCSQLLFYCLSAPFSLALSQKNEVGINSTKTNATKVSEVEALRCRDNQWKCGEECIHHRSFCSHSGECHRKHPRPCGDGARCYHRLDSCWEAACLNVDCFADHVLISDSITELDKTQTKFLLRCPAVEDRYSACPDPNYGHICFFSAEWACGDKCIGKADVCNLLKSRKKGLNQGCDWGMKRCGKKCVDRHTPCQGVCWDESSLHACGNNMCLSDYQLQDYHKCNGTCYDHTVPCHGECQSPDFYMCNSGDQCYRYWDHCDNQEHCEDASDEGGACTAREYIVYIVPILMLLFIGSLIVALICVKVRNCNFESLSLTGSRSTVPTTATNSNGNLRVEMPIGEMVIMTELDLENHDGTPSKHSGVF